MAFVDGGTVEGVEGIVGFEAFEGLTMLEWPVSSEEIGEWILLFAFVEGEEVLFFLRKCLARPLMRGMGPVEALGSVEVSGDGARAYASPLR